MSATITSVDEVPSDNPIALLRRRRVFGEKMLWAYVNLSEGCQVAMHVHDNEQIAFVISGRVVFKLGDPEEADYHEQEVIGGTVVHLPSDSPTGVHALADSVILDVLSPPGEMGVDRQDS